mgnify:FL=1
MKKNTTRRLLAALMAAAMCLTMAACGSKTSPVRASPATKMYNPTMCEALHITVPEGYEALA